ncbi:hypothetical protein QVD17_09695 [Tagetes erecta]|uniref:PB1-like domain-containing protein n=1 Tax=Tagetes erecta TaxID=13708 RepID=A0AAD8KKG9_TARER|nr:hypothetical protein QVD17_19748 [Tagetes erecta]KAK1432795.1 hypothetical protein QVD17_09695 [Tagetes erecta]
MTNFPDGLYPRARFQLRSVNEPGQAEVVEELYADRPEYFSLKVYHGGYFTGMPGRAYDYGSITFVDFLKVHEFNVSEMYLIYPEFGYGFIPMNLRFYFKHPVGDLDTGLFPLRNSEDVTLLTSYIGVNGVREIELYVVTEELNEDTGKDVKSGTWRPHVREDAPVCRRLF